MVAGAGVTVQAGLNWGVCGARTGPIIGTEVVTAFFVEAGFIGVLLCSDGLLLRTRTRHRGTGTSRGLPTRFR